MSDEGVKYDAGKARLELLPPDALYAVARVYTIGATKYDARNWEKGMDRDKVRGAVLRHILKEMAGEDLDRETGESNLAHAAWGLLTLLAYKLRGLGAESRTTVPEQARDQLWGNEGIPGGLGEHNPYIESTKEELERHVRTANMMGLSIMDFLGALKGDPDRNKLLKQMVLSQRVNKGND